MTKPFIVANVRHHLHEYNRGNISFSKMVEEFNRIAAEFYSPKGEMTKAEMIYPKIGIEPKRFTDTHQERCYPLTVVCDLMDEWAAQELAKERERAGKLVEALNKCIEAVEELNGEFLNGWYDDIKFAKQTLNEYNGTES